jgi:hypothetical protein
MNVGKARCFYSLRRMLKTRNRWAVMKRFSLLLMLGVLAWLLTIAFGATPRSDMAVCFGPFIMLNHIFAMWRLFRIRVSEGKRGLPGYWELEEELLDPMMWRDKMLLTFYVGLVVSVYLALLILQRLPAEFAVVFPSLPGFATMSYVFACYEKCSECEKSGKAPKGGKKA